MVDALLQDDALLGQHMDDNGLEKIRLEIVRSRGSDAAFSPDAAITDAPRGLYNGALLQMDDNGGFGLAEAPLGQ